MDWRRTLSAEIRSLRAVAGADQVTIILSGDQADALARGIDLWANCTAVQPSTPKALLRGDRGAG